MIRCVKSPTAPEGRRQTPAAAGDLVNGWLAPEGSVIHNRVEIIAPNDTVVFDTVEEDVTKKSAQLVIVLKGDFELNEEGWHKVRIYNGEQFYLEYRIRWHRI